MLVYQRVYHIILGKKKKNISSPYYGRNAAPPLMLKAYEKWEKT
jgi:hypothetical protein